MGLFDQLGNLNPEQTQGLLAAAAQMLQQSGPSLRPTGLGQIAGGGLQAYQASTIDAQRRKLEEDAAKQAQQMRALQMQDLQGQLADRGITRNRQAQINAALAGGDAIGQPQQQPNGAVPAQQMASVVPGGAMSPKIGGPDWMQAYQQQQGSQLPSAAATSQGQLSPPQNIAQAQADRLMKEAAVYSKFGDFDGADKRYQAAAKLLPEVNKIETGMHNRTPVRIITFRDGSEKVSEFSPAEKLSFQNTGSKILGLNGFTGKTEVSYDTTQSPDSVASNSLARDRLAFDKDRANQPTFNAEIGGFVSPPSKAAPSGTFLPLSGSPGKPLTESQGKATTFGARMTDAESVIRSLEPKGVSGSDFSTIAAGSPYTNFLATPQGQQYRQAQENWVTANLRQESGAAIGKDEMDKDVRKYFPTPGDSNEVKAQKAQSRAVATQGMIAQAGPGAAKVPAIANAGKTVSLSDIAATAKASGRSTAEVTAAFKSKGYTIGGQ